MPGIVVLLDRGNIPWTYVSFNLLCDESRSPSIGKVYNLRVRHEKASS